MAKAAGTASAAGSMNSIMKAAVQKRMAEKFGGDGSLKKAGENVINAPEIIRKGISDSINSVTDPNTYTAKINVSLEPVRLTKNLFNTNDRTFGERGYDLYRNRIENKFGSKPSAFASMADNQELNKNNEMIMQSLLEQYGPNKDFLNTPIKTIDALKLNQSQTRLANDEINKSDRKYKLKKRGIFG